MGIKIISHGQVVEKVRYYIFYEWVEKLDLGFEFPCNEQGEIDFDSMSPNQLDHYEKCDSEELPVVYRGLQREVSEFTTPAIGKCSCGSLVALTKSSNKCQKCGDYYNALGQQIR